MLLKMLYKYVKSEVKPTQNSKAPKAKIKFAYLAWSFTLLLIGVGILGYTLHPYLTNFKNRFFNNKYQNKYLLSPSQKIDQANTFVATTPEALSSSYLSNINKSISTTNKVLNIDKKTFPEYSNIKGTIYLTIPKLKFNKVPVEINVNSFDETTYMKQLETSLAHFQGTSLPDKEGNTFIYGHSTNELLAIANPNNPKYMFTFLDDLQIGDEILLEYNGKRYKYTTLNMKFVSPEDLSPIYSNSKDKILTLMTCHPPGLATQRLIITSKLVEEKNI